MEPSFFVWNVRPEVFAFSAVPRWYNLTFAAGLYGGYLLVGHFWKKLNDPRLTTEALQSLLVYVVLGMMIGMRLAHCFFYDPQYYLQNPLEILMIWKGGYASHGGFVGILFAVYLFARRFPAIPYLKLTDYVSVGAMFPSGFIRIGNFFNSEMIGHPSQLPWAVIFARIDSTPRHPTQIYEAIGYFVICAVGSWLALRTQMTAISGRLFGFILSTSASWRFFCEFFKEDQSAFESGMMINMGQMLSIPFILAGLWFLFRTKKEVAINQKEPAKKQKRRKGKK